MTRLFRVLVAGLTLTIVGFTAFVMLDGNGTAKADSPIECSSVTDENTDPDTVTLTCGGASAIRRRWERKRSASRS